MLLQQQQKEFGVIGQQPAQVNKVEEIRQPIDVQIVSKAFQHHDGIIHRSDVDLNFMKCILPCFPICLVSKFGFGLRMTQSMFLED